MAAAGRVAEPSHLGLGRVNAMLDQWSKADKRVARRLFDAALQAELQELMQRFKAMAQAAAEPDDLWAVRGFLDKAGRALDRKYDFRYSQLAFLFARLLHEGRIHKQDLRAFSEPVYELILRIVSLAAAQEGETP